MALVAFGWALAGEPMETQGAQLLGTNEVWCAPSNAVSKFAPLRPQSASTLRMVERLKQLREQADPRAMLMQRLRDRVSDAPAGAGHQGHSSLQFH